ncbi:MAG: HAMP domain-containing sensor histidine kinase [Candidatus Melainabacteria bacterium]|nr:HAMP domain-containing sensor histidine kinase [Candidatus Melainabacteria bacterium]
MYNVTECEIPGTVAGLALGVVQGTMEKTGWSKTMRFRMALAMSLSGLIPIVVCHLIVFGMTGDIVESLGRLAPWYLPLVVIVLLVNWFLAEMILRPITNLLQSTTELHSVDIRKRLEVDANEPSETLELRKSFNKLLNRLEESLNIQCQFVADASHELRTPLTSIQGYTKLLMRRGSNIDANLLGEALQTVSDESGRLIRLVSDLLQLARADAGQAIISQLEFIDLRDVVGSVEDTVVMVAPEQIEVQVIMPQAAIMVSADADRLKQVFLNLANNAIKATQAGGKVTITVRSSGEQAVIRVIDTGIGIAPADQQRIFDRFYRVERSRTRSRLYGGGSGLGLAIAMTIIKAHGGSIDLESELNKGSTFTVKLPIAKKDEKGQVTTTPLLQATGPSTSSSTSSDEPREEAASVMADPA